MAGANYTIFVRLTSENLVAFPGFSDIIKLSKERKTKLMKIRFTKKSVEAINKWLSKYGFNTECVLKNGGALQFDPNENEILIPRAYDSDYDSEFMKFLRNLGLTSNIDAVTLSILHELGHAQTMDYFTRSEWEWCSVQKAVWAGTHSEPDEEYLFGYWNFEDELAANNWLVLYTKSFEKKVQKLEEIIETKVKFG